MTRSMDGWKTLPITIYTPDPPILLPLFSTLLWSFSGSEPRNTSASYLKDVSTRSRKLLPLSFKGFSHLGYPAPF